MKWHIQAGLDAWCVRAQKAHPHPGDDVAALIAYVQSEGHGLRNRNRAIWALGQARDERAAPALEAFVTGTECNHSRFLCQYELEKAIKLARRDRPSNLLGIRTPVVSHR